MLGGTGVSVQWDGEGDPVGYEVRAGDCLVHLALEQRAHAPGRARRPRRARVRPAHVRERHHAGCRAPACRGSARRGRRSAPRRITRGRARRPPGRRAVGELSPRPSTIVNVADVEAFERVDDDDRPAHPHARARPRLAADRPPALRGASRDAQHAAALPLARGGDLRRARGRRARCCSGRRTASRSTTVRPARSVARPPGTGVAHAFRGGEQGMTAALYGTREPERHLLLPALGQDLLPRGRRDHARREQLDYWEGED